MYNCYNDKVTVWQSNSADLATALREAADLIDGNQNSWFNVTVGNDNQSYNNAMVTVYVHE